MNYDINWLDDPEVFAVNKLNPHSDHNFYKNIEDFEKEKNSLSISLNGEWYFKYSINAKERPEFFYKKDFNYSDFDKIPVPAHIEMQGYDKIHYINTMYPWEGHFYRRPPNSHSKEIIGSFANAEYNPVGSYLKKFDLNEDFIDKKIVVKFEGVEEAFYIWVNGNFIGYSEDSFVPAEFDITEFVNLKDNIIAVEVHKRSTAAYLEDQDFFRFFGIFRDVTIYAKPRLHVEDFWARADLMENNISGEFSIQMEISQSEKSGNVKYTLTDMDNKIILEDNCAISEKISFNKKVINKVTPWDNKTPYLYNLKIELFDENNNLVEIVPYKIGFRRIEIKNKIMLLNGKRLILNGVNRHEWSAKTGRAISREEMNWDMDCIKRNNINAVRTSHYPNQIPWYYMCDENGIYLMSETNLESHGSWQKMNIIDPTWNVPGNESRWKNAVLERAKANFETFKNHTSILFWSLGNESYAGDNTKFMNDYFKGKDDSRIVHYESVVHNRIYEDSTSDVESTMYAPPKSIEKYLTKNPKKPYIICEYMHCMGNSLGGMKSYIDLIDKYEMFQGGFIWDFIDQAIAVNDEITGQETLRYGGDFDDRPSDYEFSGNGIVFADRTEKPAIQEVKYYYGLH